MAHYGGSSSYWPKNNIAKDDRIHVSFWGGGRNRLLGVAVMRAMTIPLHGHNPSKCTLSAPSACPPSSRRAPGRSRSANTCAVASSPASVYKEI